MEIKFYGATRMVTGSNFLIETSGYKILVDCGLFQGNKAIERKNHEDFPYDPKEIDFLILTHAHIDHSGRIPRLVKEGFTGRILSTNATYDLCKIMLLDSAHIQETDIKWENRKRERAGRPLKKPLYTKQDASNSLNYFEPYFLNQKIKLNEDVYIRFRDAGHILGSAIIELWVKDKDEEVKLVFSGDLGVAGRPIINDPEFIEEADYLIIESTYGNKIHDSYDGSVEQLIKIIDHTALRGGTVMIPSFAVGRTQELIYKLNNYYEYADVEEHMRIPIYVDSPMAVEATEAFINNSSSFNKDTQQLVLAGDNPFVFENLNYIRSVEESMLLNKFEFPKVIISSSGMATGGRIRHHLKHNLWDEKNSLVFVGYQAVGTLGRILLDGVKRVKILGEDIEVKSEVYKLDGFSGHADRDSLLGWINAFEKKPRKVFVVHGEEEPATSLAREIEYRFRIDTVIPEYGESYEIRDRSIRMTESGQDLEKEYRKNIEVELANVTDQFRSFINREDEILDEELLKEDYDMVKNHLIELQHILMDLNMLSGK